MAKSADVLARLVLVREVEEFLYREAALLDERRFDDWLALFADDGIYWVPSRPDQDNALDTVSIVYENRQMLEVRVRRLAHPRIYAQMPPSRTRHAVANVAVEPGEEIAVRSALIMVEYRADEQRVFAADVRHRLCRAGTGFLIAEKRVDLVNCDAAHGFMSIPF